MNEAHSECIQIDEGVNINATKKKHHVTMCIAWCVVSVATNVAAIILSSKHSNWSSFPDHNSHIICDG
jgi:hypothetical protein